MFFVTISKRCRKRPDAGAGRGSVRPQRTEGEGADNQMPRLPDGAASRGSDLAVGPTGADQLVAARRPRGRRLLVVRGAWLAVVALIADRSPWYSRQSRLARCPWLTFGRHGIGCWRRSALAPRRARRWEVSVSSRSPPAAARRVAGRRSGRCRARPRPSGDHLHRHPPDGATWQIVPGRPGTAPCCRTATATAPCPNPAQDVSDRGDRRLAVDHGFALAGSSYASTGWAVKEACWPTRPRSWTCSRPPSATSRRTIAWATCWAASSPPGWSSASVSGWTAPSPPAGWSPARSRPEPGLDASFAFKVHRPRPAPAAGPHHRPDRQPGRGQQALAAAQATPPAACTAGRCPERHPGLADLTGPEPAPSTTTPPSSNTSSPT